ncbi:MAG: SurA N-terminal domain-containing protein [Bacteroidales bacterium]|nr:SurA N-terminal domain-containing protein [Bacteroidales bacterium]
MAVLEKIRVKFGLAISIIIALALLSFIIDPSTLESALHSMSSKYDVGRIAGKSISYTDYAADVDRYTTIHEIISGSSVQNEQTQQQIRNAAWQELVDKYLFVKNAKAAGITVGNDEILSLTSGETPSPLISQNPAFADEQGNFSHERFVEFVQNVDADQSGRLKTYWNYIQNTLLSQQFYAKYGSLFANSGYVNALEQERLMAQNNTSAQVDYVLLNHPFEEDSTVVVSDKDIRAFYDGHKKMFRQKANRDVEYVVFEVIPSEADIEAANTKIAEAYDEFAAVDAKGMKSFLMKNSDRQLNSYWYKEGELNSVSKDIDGFVFGAAKGVSPVFRTDNTFYAARVMDTAQVPDSAYVKHILLQGADARHKADSLLSELRKGANFAATAALYSADKGSAADGELGNIGWMTQNYMIPGFESVLTAEVGKPYTIDTQYGSHIVLVSKKSRPVLKKQVAILEKAALASRETFDRYYSQANRFATISGHSLEGYRRAVDSLGVYSHQMNVLESTSSFGSVEQAKEVTRWVFDAKQGKASDIITVNNNFFFIVAVKEIHKEGVAPVSEVSDMIRQNLYAKKLGEARKAYVAEKIAGLKSLEEIAAALGSSVSSEEFNFSSMPGSFNQDPALLGAAFTAPVGEISGPVAGAMGTYVFQVKNREAGSFYTEEDAKMFGQQKLQYASQMILPEMMEAADVKDNRARFF